MGPRDPPHGDSRPTVPIHTHPMGQDGLLLPALPPGLGCMPWAEGQHLLVGPTAALVPAGTRRGLGTPQTHQQVGLALGCPPSLPHGPSITEPQEGPWPHQAPATPPGPLLQPQHPETSSTLTESSPPPVAISFLLCSEGDVPSMPPPACWWLLPSAVSHGPGPAPAG